MQTQIIWLRCREWGNTSYSKLKQQHHLVHNSRREISYGGIPKLDMLSTELAGHTEL
jgi:hypothetical protein